MSDRSDYEYCCPNSGPAYDCGVVQALRERIAELVELVTEIHNKLEFEDVYQWDDGSVTWEKMREVAGFPSPTVQIPSSISRKV